MLHSTSSTSHPDQRNHQHCLTTLVNPDLPVNRDGHQFSSSGARITSFVLIDIFYMTLFSVENSNVQHCGCTTYKITWLTPYSLCDARSWCVVSNILPGLIPYYVRLTVVLSRIYNVATRGSQRASFWLQVSELRHVITARLARLRFSVQFACGEAPVGSEN